MNCHKTPYKHKKEARRQLELYNKVKGRTGGSIYHCHTHMAYHVTKKAPIDHHTWDLIKNDVYIQNQLG